MKLNRNELEKMFPEKNDAFDNELGDSICPDEDFWEEQSQNSCLNLGYNAARNEIIDKLCGMEIKIPNCITVDNETFQQITDDSVDYQAVQETRDYFVGTLEDTLEVEDET